MKACSERGAASGFTLVELLVAISVFAILSIALAESLKYGVRSWQGVSATDDQTDEIETAQRFLRRSISAAYPLFSGPAIGQEEISFWGTSETMKFLTPLPKGLGEGGYAEVTLLLEATATGKNFVAIMRPELGADRSSLSSRTLLVGKISGIHFSYFGIAQDGQNPSWSSAWENRSRLPQLISIDIEFPTGDGRFWPHQIVAPVIAADVGCVYASLTKSCRGR